MGSWIKFFGFHLMYFIIVGAIGGMTWLYALKEYSVSQGQITDGQVEHAVMVLKQVPSEFKEMIRLLETERLPISEKEKLLFDERKRLRVERQLYAKDKKVWDAYREEELSRLREEKKRQDDKRVEVDQMMEILKNREKQVSALANQILTEKYKKYVDVLVKLEPIETAKVLIDRPTKEIVQDLRQLKPGMAASVITAMSVMADAIKEETERDDAKSKMSEVITLFRARDRDEVEYER